jgi:hypothetical protein
MRSLFGVRPLFFINAQRKHSVYIEPRLLHVHAPRPPEAQFTCAFSSGSSTQARSCSMPSGMRAMNRRAGRACFTRRINLVNSMGSGMHNWMTAAQGIASIGGTYGKAAVTDAVNVKRPPAGSRLYEAS